MRYLKSRIKEIREQSERGAISAEYAIATLAAAGIGGLLIAILKSDGVRQQLTQMITSVLSVG